MLLHPLRVFKISLFSIIQSMFLTFVNMAMVNRLNPSYDLVEWAGNHDPGGFHPVHFGHLLHCRYRVCRKLGCSVYLTVARPRRMHALSNMRVTPCMPTYTYALQPPKVILNLLRLPPLIPATDIWPLGLVIYQLVTLSNLWPSSSFAETAEEADDELLLHMVSRLGKKPEWL